MRLAVLLVVGTLTQPAQSPFVSAASGFSVAFPREPIHETLTVPTSGGPQLRHVFRYADDDAIYFVVFTCTPPPPLPSDPRKALQVGREEWLRTAGSKVISDKPIMINGYHGREFVEEVGGQRARGRTVMGPNGAFYSLTAAERSEPGTGRASAFLDSFRILPEARASVCRSK
jgi:hypothetical protein